MFNEEYFNMLTLGQSVGIATRPDLYLRQKTEIAYNIIIATTTGAENRPLRRHIQSQFRYYRQQYGVLSDSALRNLTSRFYSNALRSEQVSFGDPYGIATPTYFSIALQMLFMENYYSRKAIKPPIHTVDEILAYISSCYQSISPAPIPIEDDVAVENMKLMYPIILRWLSRPHNEVYYNQIKLDLYKWALFQYAQTYSLIHVMVRHAHNILKKMGGQDVMSQIKDEAWAYTYLLDSMIHCIWLLYFKYSYEMKYTII